MVVTNNVINLKRRDKEVWIYQVNSDSNQINKVKTSRNIPEITAALTTSAPRRTNDLQTVLEQMFEIFKNHSFLNHKAQGFLSYPLLNSFKIEESDWKKHFGVFLSTKYQPMAILLEHMSYSTSITAITKLKN